MLKECIDIFKSELNYKGERLLLDSYIPTDGTYIIVAKENDNFIIKEENYEIFKETIGARVEPHIHVEYCFQKNDNVPENYEIPEDRVKPLGTGHAILCCKDKIDENIKKIGYA